MSQCLNPTCLHQNLQDASFCEKCGGKILLDGRYRPIKILGEGGFGRTFQALDEKRLNTPCVIKQFLPQQAGSIALQKATELFKQESKRLQELGKHPQIPDLLAFFPEDGRLYLIQEFIDGQNLLQELQNKGTLKEPEIKTLLEKLLPVLQFIHDNQVIHRDIKLENIIKSKNGTLFLIDFGVSKETTGSILTRFGTITGTPGFAPPEQFRGIVYHSSDLYSLAVTCVRLLTGHLQEINGVDKLFDTNTMQWQWQKYVSVSQELKDVLETMLQDIPANRYQSATEVLAALSNTKARVRQQVSPHSSKQSIYSPTNITKIPGNTPLDINSALSFTEDLGKGVKLEMIAIPGGTFLMGSPENEVERFSDESPQHEVTVPGFFIGKYQLTQLQYQTIMGTNPSYFKGDNRPVEGVCWEDAVKFCQKLNHSTLGNYRLPSEAEWEYACRAGTKTPFHFGDNVTTDLVNYNGNYPYPSAPKGKYREQTTDVGIFPPNAFGLYDMHGNVWEWCEDERHENYINAPTDGSSWQSRISVGEKVLRGGCWHDYARYCRSACRLKSPCCSRNYFYGFRVVLSPSRS
ncbi:bifunctional serine/threonine-protein kinase/formylglycine-generating enzyme family protein [Aphanizomenon flos-aquae NRERC-008]|uniref:SUMF1/EgtB/PvdO family nonheme iron enzyme n=1 Tax=Aphanizomenon flos-aquae FACHB-1249 TaxID=2692889 RepID=A0ABR8IM55_APHFL|nr:MULTISPECIES: bifunctional serine/threonine-protein kinase/formylglycine-generating enzyme family protein [Aphanizomenon]MBD2389397.1 SUMF1/EgtB/PvdO family nonheme iron enzyme [Aphanizomenon flos-aquae FACHB-1171]MBD2555871.1 SUMF1/EgtB/PvdO family nonheme iron enzyme [Aphanizomenon flos-aquae FACHB-1290]MBD2631953.1 SUMF1/EgtB/PvdO family nonheme iron enzyme [Aphanizomenon sp. FACHB-1399]MBD2641969.1 SUMF1/EgtB/PvdO family nonheme iron enzyme [Aphanizomenon sp. FACHB-1401]MBD2656457.1 SUM